MTSDCAVAFAPPASPLPAPRVTTGILFSFAYLRASEISAALLARRTAKGGWCGANGAWSCEYDAVISGSVMSDALYQECARKLAAWLIAALYRGREYLLLPRASINPSSRSVRRAFSS
jgi:hypothetical protein